MIDIINPMIKKFLPFAQERMGFKNPPKLFLRGSPQNAADPLGKTAFYDPQAKSVTIYITDRHPKDVMRSLSHELVHHTQNCQGDFDHVGEMGEGYAQNDEHLREMEREAYEKGNMCFRDWEDSIKSTIYFEHLQKGANKTMSIKEWKNGELTTLLSEAWGFNFDLQPLNETGAKDTGASKGDESKTDPGEEDYTTKKGGKTKKGEEDDELEEGAASSGRQSPHKDRRGDDKRKRPMEEADIEEGFVDMKATRRPQTARERGLSKGGYADAERAERKNCEAGGGTWDNGECHERGERGASNPLAQMREEQIREVARRIVARLKETKKNG
jgi:hypothetical protein